MTAMTVSSPSPLSELCAEYWQWIYSIPKGQNPLDTGQVSTDKEEFICLPCTGGGEDCSRKYNVSEQDANKDILVPVFTVTWSTAEAQEQQLLALAREDVRDAQELVISVDGKTLTPEYVETRPFDVQIPTNFRFDGPEYNNPSNIQPGRYKAISAGYWYRLKPLPKGEHVVRFGGTGHDNFFHTKVQYTLNIR
jgi:hypothetical protein